MTTATTVPETAPKNRLRPLAYDLIMVYVLVLAAFLRLVGLYWGEFQYLHPDERFMVWVGSDVSPTKMVPVDNPAEGEPAEKEIWLGLDDYFDTVNSSLNPNNRGHGFYVYGTLPVFTARYLVEFIYGHSGFKEMTLVGRPLSALADVLSVLFVYLIAARLYDRRVGVLAGAFAAVAVLQIQQAHFFTVDTFLNFFIVLSFYFAIRILTERSPWPALAGPGDGLGPLAPQKSSWSAGLRSFAASPFFRLSIGFGIAYGCAMASKLNALPVAGILPVAFAIRLLDAPGEERQTRVNQAILYLLLAGIVSILIFRIFQPYAFSGPGFFGFKPNPAWVEQIRTQRSQSTPEFDYPPNMQWARRSFWFSGKNLVVWGLGLPLGILAWAGFLWAGWRMLTNRVPGEWRRHILLWSWTGLYFLWQSSALNPTMRYQLPIYATLQIFAAWFVVRLWDTGTETFQRFDRRIPWGRAAAVLVGGGVLIASLAWAYSFVHIYMRPTTRVAATRWIYQNVPGPINLPIQTPDGLYNQPLSFPYNFLITPGIPYEASFRPNRSGSLSEVMIPHIQDATAAHAVRRLTLTLSATPDRQNHLASAALEADLTATGDPRGQAYTFELSQPVSLVAEDTYYLSLSLEGQEEALLLEGSIDLQIQDEGGFLAIQSLPPSPTTFHSASPLRLNFEAQNSGLLTGLSIPNGTDPGQGSQPKTVLVYLYAPTEEALGVELATGEPAGEPTLLGSFRAGGAQASQASIELGFELPVPILASQAYILELAIQSDQGIVSLAGSSIATEGDWDDGLPLRMDNYDGYGGIYPPELNLNMYWDDNPEKLDRFVRILNQSDYLTISSSRQWGSLPRMPERFPMTTLYYRELMGCPAEMTIEHCYNIADPGMFTGQLGFELVQTFQSNPSIGPFEINDQPSEEAFTVYDHPKVFIFKKTTDYSPEWVEARLGSVDFSQVLRIAPLKFSSYPADLMLPSDRWAEQQAGGSWSQLFNTRAWQNAYPALGAVIWYLSVSLLGLLVYPLLRRMLPGLADRGYPLARTTGMLLLAWVVWVLGSNRVPFTRQTISAVLGLIALSGLVAAYRQKEEIWRELKARRRFFLLVELLALGLFLAFLLVRLGNPDLWHPWKGGEKPMDFAYFNAVLKSTSFPPYDPWFSGGYLNYYYFGFVFVGVLVKWLGIVPSIAYNLILPTIFSLVGLGAFSIVYNLSANKLRQEGEAPTPFRLADFWIGLAGSAGMILLGNLGTVRMIFQGYQKIVAPGGVIEGANVFQQWLWAFQGFFQALAGASLPYGLGDWYWIPSRAIPAPGDVEPITEFPLFTMLYADPHAHMFAMPIALLALAFSIAVVLGRAQWKNWLAALGSLWLGGLAIGALRPTNTWDFYPYLALGSVGLGYALLANFKASEKSLDRLPFLKNIPALSLRIMAAVGGVTLLVVLAHLLYQPFADWYGLGYSKIDLWKGTHTPLEAYLTHWGLFLFVIVSWMFWETHEWMANTPLVALRKLEPYKPLILAGLVILLGMIMALLFLGAGISGLVLPLAAWAGLLLIRPGQSEARRVVLFLVGTGLVLTLMVEVVVLRGDIGRMNTVFKFYLQVWTLLVVSAAAALGWLAPELRRWLPNWRITWQVALAVLVAGAALYPLMGGLAKIKDRMAPEAPATLDGMTYMTYATYADTWGQMDLSQDYRAIRWMQENVQGSPVIVEANLRDLYRWGSRLSIYTGLPGVSGWEWHQQQQRAVVPGNRVSARIQEIDDFYLTQDLQLARNFLHKYEVKYIILGQQERGKYPGPGLEKFPAAEGVLWREVYREGSTIIYEVIDPPG